MPSYLTHKLEFSVDPLSDTTPAWTDISAYVMEADWFSGKSKDIDDPQAGGATFVLRNRDRRFEPEYAAGAYYPNIVPLRRFRWSITADGVTYPQGIYYAQSWRVSYPNPGSTESVVVVSCVDGFGVLSLYALPTLDTSDAEDYSDVVISDNPWGYWPLNESGGQAMNASVGPSGVFKGNVMHVRPNPVVGDSGYAMYSNVLQTYGRAKLDDETTWVDSGQVSVEGVVLTASGGANPTILLGPFRTTTTNDYTFGLQASSGWVYPTAASLLEASGGTPSLGLHHVAMTYDGGTVRYYLDGVLSASVSGSGNAPVTPDANEFIRIGGNGLVGGRASILATLSHVAVYTYALPAERVAAHATAALSRGYAADTAGNRIAALATHPLWSTASIPAGEITVHPVMQHGQGALDEIGDTVKAETPLGLFYFDDSGNPAYEPFEYDTTLQATFGEQEVQYDDFGLQYDDELFNQSTVSREDGIAATASDATSQGSYSVRAHDESGLILQNDSDAALIAQAIVDRFKDPMYRVETLTLNGAAPNRRTQILTREIGDTIRVKRRGAGGTANPDVIVRILGKSKHLDAARNLTATWNLSRGFPAGDAHWRLGHAGYTELGTNTVLA